MNPEDTTNWVAANQANVNSNPIWAQARLRKLAWAGCASLMLNTCFAHAQDTNGTPTEVRESIRRLKQLSLDEVLNEPITIVSKSPENMSTAAAAVQVVTGDDIHRSAAMTLPEALRLAPNLEVARVNSSDWAISARGFNNTLANKLLVMIDGRTVYTPLYAGVFWDAQHTFLPDIDRIEVVSGPGGTLWGANAVNGVINVISKSAKETQGAYVEAAAGTLVQDYLGGRYGGSIGTNFFYRAYAQRYDWNNTLLANRADAPDDWELTQGGFRTDWEATPENLLTFQGDFYVGNKDGVAGQTDLDGQNLLGRFTHTISPESDVQVQMYLDRTWRMIPNSFSEELTTWDLDIQHRFPLGDRQSLVWGGGYRLMVDEIKNSAVLGFLPEDQNLQLFSLFAQDEITLVPERVRLTAGIKMEHNDYSGLEWQPSVRLAWTPDERNTIWGAISRAVRSPSRIDTEVVFPPPPVPPGTLSLVGNPDFDSEKLLAFEIGYRVRPTDKLMISLATYYHDYQDLRSVDELTPTDLTLGNHFEGYIWGIELSAQYHVTDWWRVVAGYNYLNKNISPDGTPNVSSSIREGNDPEHQVTIRSVMDLPANFQFDIHARYVSELPTPPTVPCYFVFDARVAWRCDNLEIAVIGKSLGKDEHQEFGTGRIPHSVFGKVTWSY